MSYTEQKKNLEEQGWKVSNSIGGKSYFDRPGISGLVVEVDQATGEADIHIGCPEYFAEEHKPSLRGGKRPGAGRKPTGRKKRNYYVTDKEHEQIKSLIAQLREEIS